MRPTGGPLGVGTAADSLANVFWPGCFGAGPSCGGSGGGCFEVVVAESGSAGCGRVLEVVEVGWLEG